MHTSRSLAKLDRTERVQLARRSNSEKDLSLLFTEWAESHLALAENPYALHLQEQLAQSDGYRVRARLAANTALLVGVQRLFSRDLHVAVRAYVAGNPAVEKEILEELAGDVSPEVRGHVAGNPSIDVELQERLVKDEWNVVLVLASNPALVVSLQERLAEAGEEVRERLARNTSLCESVQEQLSVDTSVLVRRELAGNTGLSQGIQEKLTYDRVGEVIYFLGVNPSMQFTEKMSASFCVSHAHGFLLRWMDERGVEAEWKELAYNWNGSVEELWEAVVHLGGSVQG